MNKEKIKQRKNLAHYFGVTSKDMSCEAQIGIRCALKQDYQRCDYNLTGNQDCIIYADYKNKQEAEK